MHKLCTFFEKLAVSLLFHLCETPLSGWGSNFFMILYLVLYYSWYLCFFPASLLCSLVTWWLYTNYRKAHILFILHVTSVMQVSHHPMVVACHCEGTGWKFWGDITLKSKFWGRSIQLDPVGALTLEFDDGEFFQWSKVSDLYWRYPNFVSFMPIWNS